MAANAFSLPLYEKVHIKNPIQRGLDITLLFLLCCLLIYRVMSLQNHGVAWFLAFLCESWFTFTWILVTATKFTPLVYKTYPEHVQQRVKELPPVDMFVTTADPVLEPPIITVNTVLSLMAVDYPTDKLACYVSDDACSALNFYSLVETSKFAKLWVPFCKKYDVQVRAPFRYFLDEFAPFNSNLSEFRQEWKKMKDEYQKLCQKINSAATDESALTSDLSGEYLAALSDTERGNHPPIIKVIWENKERDTNGLPHLIYISREKRYKHPHHYKAGAMNALIRVSGLMTNAPFMLNVDCDMYAHNPTIVLRAMCLLLDSKEAHYAFVQSPQLFYDRPADPVMVINKYVFKGFVGIQGPACSGTGCFLRRKVIYGQYPDEDIGKIVGDGELIKIFGNSMEFIRSAANALQGNIQSPANLSGSLESAHRVASCGYESDSTWGKKVGLFYGSTVEDILTGLLIHAKGWKTSYCSPHPPAFLGCATPSGPPAMIQQKRWATGLLEILFSKYNPILGTFLRKLQFRQCLAYLWLLTWGLRSIPELCYIVLPAYCIITNSNFMPEVQESAIWIPVAIFLMYNLYTLSEYIQTGFSFCVWWSNQCGARIVTTSAWLFAVLDIILKLLGSKKLIFEITPKNLPSTGDENDDNEFTFDESSYFVPGTTIVMIHLIALGTCLLRLQPRGRNGVGLGEILCSVYVMLLFMPFMLGFFKKGKYGIPSSTIWKSTALALGFVHLCKMSSRA